MKKLTLKFLEDFFGEQVEGFVFDGTNEDILVWVICNLDKFNLNEERSCSVTLEDSTIFISGDEDLKEFEIKEFKPIKL